MDGYHRVIEKIRRWGLRLLDIVIADEHVIERHLPLTVSSLTGDFCRLIALQQTEFESGFRYVIACLTVFLLDGNLAETRGEDDCLKPGRICPELIDGIVAEAAHGISPVNRANMPCIWIVFGAGESGIGIYMIPEEVPIDPVLELSCRPSRRIASVIPHRVSDNDMGHSIVFVICPSRTVIIRRRPHRWIESRSAIAKIHYALKLVIIGLDTVAIRMCLRLLYRICSRAWRNFNRVAAICGILPVDDEAVRYLVGAAIGKRAVASELG